jgi:hypothetical protein
MRLHIGCVATPGEGKTIPHLQTVNRKGDNFDIDFVVHEMGHQWEQIILRTSLGTIAQVGQAVGRQNYRGMLE